MRAPLLRESLTALQIGGVLVAEAGTLNLRCPNISENAVCERVWAPDVTFIKSEINVLRSTVFKILSNAVFVTLRVKQSASDI